MNIKRAVSGILTGLIIISGTITGVLAEEPITPVIPANPVIYRTSESKIITSGVTQETITRYTGLGWQKIYVLKADLNDSNVHIDTLVNRDTIQKPLSTTDHMKEWGAIAGINASFFLASEQAGLQNPIGPMVQSHNIKSAETAFNRDNDNMATFGIDDSDSSVFGYWKTDIRLYAPNGEYISATRYNKPYYGYEEFTVIDRKWRTTTIGTRDGYYPDITEMIVEGGVVKEIRQSMTATDIPVNGYVVITRGKNTNQLLNNFEVGDTIIFDITTSPDWTNMKMAVSGGGMLVADGVVPESFTHIAAGRHPRTAIGSTEDGKTLFMVTVDGRQSHSIGMTMEELAAFMLEIGCYQAINMDGGGSATMAAREPGTESITVQNSPSDGVQRRIPNAVGVFSLAPPSPLAGLYIDTEDSNIFVNTTRTFTVKGYDQYFNPVIINPEDVEWQVAGVEGSFLRNIFRPTSEGHGMVTATVGNVTAEFPVHVIGGPVKLSISHQNLTLISQERKTFTVKGLDGSGYEALINPTDISWKTTGGIGFFSNGTFISTESGYGYIRAFVGNVSAYCAVTVLPTKSTLADTFEKANGSFLPYPATVQGAYTISSEQKHGGNTSGKLSYNFEAAETNRAVYMELSGPGISLPQNAIRIGLWVYNSQENSNWLRIEVKDSKNTTYRLGDLTKLDWKGWRYVEIPLNGVPLPAQLTRIYLVQVNPVTEIGAVYFDDLSIITVEQDKMTQDSKIKQLENTVIRSFENDDISFLSYPSWVPGDVDISNEYANSGSFSARLDYVFKESPETQAAYLMLGSNGITIPNGTKTIGLWAYSRRFTQSWLRAEIMDASGKRNYVMLAEGITWTGWRYVEANIENISKPARITRLYVVNPKPLNEEGHIYLDDLQFTVKTPEQADFKNLPKDTVPVDPKSQAITFIKGENNYRFSVFGQTREPANDVEKYLADFLADKINKYIEIGTFVGSGSYGIVSKVDKPVLATGSGYKSVDMQDSRFIQLDMKTKSLRNGSADQWNWLLDQLNSFNGQNVFLFLENAPETFTDKMEGNLLKDILSEYSSNKFGNVWVFYNGAENKVTMDGDVRYLSTRGFDIGRLTNDNRKAAQYILVTILGEQVTYEYKPIE